MSNQDQEDLDHLEELTEDADRYFSHSVAWLWLNNQMTYSDWLDQHRYDRSYYKDRREIDRHLASSQKECDTHANKCKELEDSFPPAGDDIEKQALVDTIKEMFHKQPGMADALEECGIKLGIKAARGDMKMISQSQLYLQRELKAMSRAFSQLKMVSESASPDPEPKEVQISSPFGEYFMKNMGIDPASVDDGLSQAIEQFLRDISTKLYTNASQTALEGWLAWYPDNTGFPSSSSVPRPHDGKDMLILSVSNFKKICYAGLHNMVRQLLEDKADENQLRIVAFNLQTALHCMTDSMKSQPELVSTESAFVCYRAIELLARMSDYTDAIQKNAIDTLLGQLQLPFNVITHANVLIAGIQEYLQHQPLAQSPASNIYQKALLNHRCLPYRAGDSSVAVAAQQLLISLNLQNGLIKGCGLEAMKVQLMDELEYEVLIPAFNMVIKVARSQQTWYYYTFKAHWDELFQGM